jgi:hypothetical protein
MMYHKHFIYEVIRDGKVESQYSAAKCSVHNVLQYNF